MNIVKQFAGLVQPERTELAKITGDRGNGAYSAESQGGVALILYGDAEVGKNVWYDAHSNKIIGAAPQVNLVDIPV